MSIPLPVPLLHVFCPKLWCSLLCAEKTETAEEATARHRAEDKEASEDAGWVRRDGVGWVKS